MSTSLQRSCAPLVDTLYLTTKCIILKSASRSFKRFLGLRSCYLHRILLNAWRHYCLFQQVRCRWIILFFAVVRMYFWLWGPVTTDKASLIDRQEDCQVSGCITGDKGVDEQLTMLVYCLSYGIFISMTGKRFFIFLRPKIFGGFIHTSYTHVISKPYFYMSRERANTLQTSLEITL